MGGGVLAVALDWDDTESVKEGLRSSPIPNPEENDCRRSHSCERGEGRKEGRTKRQEGTEGANREISQVLKN
jgi:hypothetical protein